MDNSKIKVLFVCLGNICRSPMAEGIFNNIVKERNLLDKLFTDSAGTSTYHIGQTADSRMISSASRRGYKLLSRAREFKAKDFNNFDYILAMDESNFNNITKLDINSNYKDKIFLMNDFSVNYINSDVPDPYYGGKEGFNNVIDILEESCIGLFNYIKDLKL